MAALDFPTSPATNQIFTAANGTSYRWTGTMWVAAVRGMIVSDTPPANPGPGQQWWNSLLGVLMIYYADANSSQWVPATGVGTNKLLQEVSFESGAWASGTTTIPLDDTIPQQLEGDQYLALSITPFSAVSKLIIEPVVVLSPSVTSHVTVALFQDIGANALAAVTHVMATAAGVMTVGFRHAMTSGTTSATTFKVRAGMSTAGTLQANGSGGGRYFGGAAASSIVIREVAP